MKILMIGNSFADDTMDYVYQIASSLGAKDITLGILYIGGCSIERHYENTKTLAKDYEFRFNNSGVFKTEYNTDIDYGILYEDWDIITFQQCSGYSGVNQSYENLKHLMEYVKNKATNKNVKFYFNMTWAYQKDTDRNEYNLYYNSDQLTMYKMVVKTVQEETKSLDFVDIIPVGTAIQNARTSSLGDTIRRSTPFLIKYIISSVCLRLSSSADLISKVI